MHDKPDKTRPDSEGAFPYLGGRVAPYVGEGRRPTTLEADVMTKNIENVRKLGGTVSGRVVRIPAQYAGLACVDWLSKNGFRVKML